MAADFRPGGADGWLGVVGAGYLACARELWEWYGRHAAANDSAMGPASAFAPAATEALADYARRFFLGFAGPLAGAPRPAVDSPPSPAMPPAAPALGWLREHQERWQAWVEAGARFGRAQATFGTVLAPAARRAAEAFAAQLAASPPPAGPRALFDRWIDVAEAAWSELAHSAAYAAAFAELVDAGLEVQRRGRALADQAARAFGLPTRVEIDEMQRALHELRQAARDRDRGPPA